ncbi:MAG: hypothetical protein DME97_11995 [Verrucomicrobia bacterium]|nr:MAG: hypothetical protein DME97_11995 [Verrucomicrobiota bacterium]
MYKYCGDWGVDIVRFLQLKVTPPDQFNDPFEFMPAPAGCFNLSDLNEIMSNEKAMREDFDTLKAQGAPLQGFESYRRYLQQQIQNEKFTDKLKGGFKTIEAPERCRNLCKEVSESLGLVCFTTKPENLLMWSHYANGHKGLVIGFDSDHAFFNERCRLRPVEYPKSEDDRRFVWDFSLNPGDDGYQSMAETFIVTKSRRWHYEDEWRMLLELESLERRLICGGVLGYFINFPVGAITKVILGYRCPFDTEQAIREVMKLHGLSPRDKLLRAEPHATEFKLQFVNAG